MKTQNFRDMINLMEGSFHEAGDPFAPRQTRQPGEASVKAYKIPVGDGPYDHPDDKMLWSFASNQDILTIQDIKLSQDGNTIIITPQWDDAPSEDDYDALISEWQHFATEYDGTEYNEDGEYIGEAIDVGDEMVTELGEDGAETTQDGVLYYLDSGADTFMWVLGNMEKMLTLQGNNPDDVAMEIGIGTFEQVAEDVMPIGQYGRDRQAEFMEQLSGGEVLLDAEIDSFLAGEEPGTQLVLRVLESQGSSTDLNLDLNEATGSGPDWAKVEMELRNEMEGAGLEDFEIVGSQDGDIIIASNTDDEQFIADTFEMYLHAIFESVLDQNGLFYADYQLRRTNRPGTCRIVVLTSPKLEEATVDRNPNAPANQKMGGGAATMNDAGIKQNQSGDLMNDIEAKDEDGNPFDPTEIERLKQLAGMSK